MPMPFATWEQDPEFSALPFEERQKVYSNYFNTQMADDEYRGLPTTEQDSIRTNFLNAYGYETPEVPEREPTVKRSSVLSDVGKTAKGMLFGEGLPEGAGYLQKPLETAADYWGSVLMSPKEEQEMRGKYPNLMASRYAAASLLMPGISEKLASPTELEEFVKKSPEEQRVDITGLAATYAAFGAAGKLGGEALAALGRRYPSLTKPISNFIKESDWFRQATIKQRGIVVQSVDDMANAGLSEGQILRELKKSGNFQEFEARAKASGRMKGEEAPKAKRAEKPIAEEVVPEARPAEAPVVEEGISGKTEVAPEIPKAKEVVSPAPEAIADVDPVATTEVEAPRAEEPVGIPKGEKITVTDKGVRDHSQQAVLQGDTITVNMKVGRKKRGSYTIPVSEWQATSKHPNPAFAKKKLVEKHIKIDKLREEPGGGPQADRIADSGISAINKAFEQLEQKKAAPVEKPSLTKRIRGLEKARKAPSVSQAYLGTKEFADRNLPELDNRIQDLHKTLFDSEALSGSDLYDGSFPIPKQGGIIAARQSQKYATEPWYKEKVDSTIKEVTEHIVGANRARSILIGQPSTGAFGVDYAVEKVKAGYTVNVARAWNMEAKSKYPYTSQLGNISIREGLQNSLDAVLESIQNKQITNGKIDIATTNSTFGISDNGVGMSDVDIADKFLALHGTGKDKAGRFGGFGIAKAVILGPDESARWVLKTRDNEFNSDLAQEGAQVLTLDKPIQGTEITVETDKIIVDDDAKKYVESTEFPKNVKATYNGDKVEFPFKGKRKKKETVTRLNDDTTLTSTYYPKSPSGYNKVEILRLVDAKTGSKLTQAILPIFNDGFNGTIITDIDTTATPGSSEYPLTDSRMELKWGGRKETDKIIEKHTVDKATAKRVGIESRVTQIVSRPEWVKTIGKVKNDKEYKQLTDEINSIWEETGNFFGHTGKAPFTPLHELDVKIDIGHKGYKGGTPFQAKHLASYEAVARLYSNAAGANLDRFYALLSKPVDGSHIASEYGNGNLGLNYLSIDKTSLKSPLSYAMYLKGLIDHELTHYRQGRHDEDYTSAREETHRQTGHLFPLTLRIAEAAIGKKSKAFGKPKTVTKTVEREKIVEVDNIIKQYIPQEQLDFMFENYEKGGTPHDIELYYPEPKGTERQLGLFGQRMGRSDARRSGERERSRAGGSAELASPQGDAEAVTRGVGSRKARDAEVAETQKKRTQRGSVGVTAPSQKFQYADPKKEIAFQKFQGRKKPSVAVRAKDLIVSLKNKAAREYQYLPKNKKNAEVGFALRQLSKQKGVSTTKALRDLIGITVNLDKNTYDVFARKVILEDLLETANEGKAVPKEWMGKNTTETKANLKSELERVDAYIESNPTIKESVRKRGEVWKDLRTNYIKAMDDIGFNVDQRFNRESYFRHQVLEYVESQGIFGTGKRLKTPTKRGFLEKRRGSEMAINYDYLEAEQEVMSQMLYDTEVAKTIRRIDDNYNIEKEVRKYAKENGTTFEQAIKNFDGYESWQPREGNVFYQADTIPAKLAQSLYDGAMEEVGITVDDLRKATAIGGKRKQFVIPSEIANTLNELVKQKSVGDIIRLNRQVVTKWKQWQLTSPRRYAKYNIRNMTGDAEAAFVGNASTFKKAPQAAKELFNVYFQKQPLSQNMQDWFERGGTESTLQAQEMGDFQELKDFSRLTEREFDAKKIPLKTWRQYWKAARLTTDFRESILRYASYLDYLDQMKASPNGTPKNFGASRRDEVMGLKDIKDRAFMLSNDLLGAYDRVGIMGQALRENLYPFWSWQEVNAKRYMQMTKNAAEDGQIASKVGLKILGKTANPYTAWKLGKFAIKATAFWMMLEAYNRTMFPKEEAALPEEIRSRPHIVLGVDDNGETLYFNRIGTLGDILEWFGLDAAPKHVRNWLDGKSSLKDIGKDMGKSITNKAFQGLYPLAKIAGEIVTDTALFPSVWEPRHVRSNAEQFARNFGLDNEFKAVFGKPSRPYAESLSKLVTYKSDPLRAAYSDTYQLKKKFLKSIGKYGEGFWQTDRGDALYNWRTALKYNDEKAQDKYLKEYISLYLDSGGDANKIKTNLKASLKRMHPLSGLNEKERIIFVSKLTDDDKERLMRAYQFFIETITPQKEIEDG